MSVVHADALFQAAAAAPQLAADPVVRVQPGTTPDYDRGNSLITLLRLVEQVQLAAERESYLHDHLQYLFPYDRLALFGPQGADADVLDPARQDNKTDFQKQNVASFVATDTLLVRGWAAAGDWVGPFLRVSYRGGPDSRLSSAANHQLGPDIRLWMRAGSAATPQLLTVPYHEQSDRYEIEVWGYQGPNLSARLGPRGREALRRGELVVAPELLRGRKSDFDRGRIEDQLLTSIAPDNAMHPVRPLHVELAFADREAASWDSRGGANYHYEFNMVVRGWDNYLGVGISPNPHGGVGFLEYRNLLSNYGRYAGGGELGRTVQPWNFDALGRKEPSTRREEFMAVDYMDLHILNAGCGIGLHRHRDNQEAFLMMEGRGYMVVGDWCRMPQRERCFEIRTLRAGHLALLKGGNLHGLMNATDEDISLFMFGGYD